MFSMSASKRVYAGDPNFEETLLQWYEEDDEETSDIEDRALDPDFAIFSDHESTDEQSADENEINIHKKSESHDSDSGESSEGDRSAFYGRNRVKWSKKAPNKQVRTRAENIIIHLPGLKGPARLLSDEPNPIQIWKLLFTDKILDEIVIHTNQKIEMSKQLYKNIERPELKPVDIVELQAFLGLLLFTSIYKSGHERLPSLFATNGRGRDIFRSTMSLNRCLLLNSFLRFDDRISREERKKDDPLAAISSIFDGFVKNCQENFCISEVACVDEMLVGFRGRCKFKMYIPSKPNKYGLKVQCLTDAKSGYLYNAYVYCGKGSDSFTLSENEKKLAIPTQSVIRLVKPLEKSNRNITGDSWFSSNELVEELRKRGLTYVGTLRKNKKEIPIQFLPSKVRPVGDVHYGFTKDKTIISYVPKPNKSVILISSLHHEEKQDLESEKPEIIAFYNGTKGGVDSLDQKCSVYSTSRRTRRWSMALFYAILNISSVNSYIIYQSCKNAKKIDRFQFIDELAYQLVEPHIRRR